jgi:hypothetical protein
MNPPSPTGFFIYKVIGGAFDRLNDLVTQFRNDYSILDCSVGSVEIVNGFPEEPDTNHTYYVHQYNTSTDACFTKYSFVDGEWVSETVTGDVLNSLDVFWGRPYNLPRPLLYEGQKREYLFIDNGTNASHNDTWTITSNMQRTRNDSYTTLSNVGSRSQMAYPISSTTKFSGDITIEWENYATTYQLDYLIIRGTSDTAKTFGALGINKVCNVKITVVGTTCKCYIDGVEKHSYTINRDANNQFQVRLQINPNGNDIKYKNFRIYTGEEKERPLTDEEYRIYLYLKNHQLLTMKDLLVAFTNAFGSAETGTTLLNSIHTVDHKTYDNPPFSNDSLSAYGGEDMDITTDKLVDKDGVNLINNRLAQGTTSILIPDDGWDEEFLSLLESFISIKGNILISTGG